MLADSVEIPVDAVTVPADQELTKHDFHWAPDLTDNPIQACTKASAVDLLVVVDNSGSMKEEQESLRQSLGKFIDALRAPQFGSDGTGNPCSAMDTSGCALPDLHIGIVSTDVGAGNFGTGNCGQSGGDAGKLQNTPRVPGCTAPTDPFIAYSQGKTNIPGVTTDAVQGVKDSFSCIVELGTSGCGYEQPLEAAYQALAPNIGTNPAFLRKSALLAVLILSDEDDCSAQNTALFNQNDSTLGPLNFRCFAHGVVCDGNPIDLNTTGALQNCAPSTGASNSSYLWTISRYWNFFAGLKTPGQIVVSTIAGPATPVVVNMSMDGADLQASCSSAAFGLADPAIRLKGFTQPYIDKGVGAFTNICTGDFLSETAKLITQCL
jgi:hypothetical protein